MTSHYKTGTHPFYIGMYIHIYTHIYVHIYTSQKECLHIFVWVFGFGFYQRVLQVECHNKRMVPATAMSGVTCLHREI